LAPFLAITYFSIKDKFKRRLIIIGIVVLSPIAQSVFGWNNTPFKMTLLGHLQHFLLGFFLSDLFIFKYSFFKIKNWIWDILGISGFLMMMHMWSSDWSREILFSLGVLLVFLAAFKGNILNTLMKNSWIITIGGMCYTIYLIHLPLIELITKWSASFITSLSFNWVFLVHSILIIPVIFIASSLFFLMLEKPFMKPNWQMSFLNWLTQKINLFLQFRYTIMRRLLFLIVIIITSSLFPRNVIAQGLQESSSKKSQIIDVDFTKSELITLLPLKDIINMALENSPLIKFHGVKIENLDLDLQLIRRKWTDYINFGGSYLLGSSAYVDAVQTLAAADYKQTNRNNTFSSVSLSARIPLGEFITKKPKIKKVLNERKMEELSMDLIAQQIRNTVINFYTQFHTKVKLLKLKSNELETLRITAKLAEEYLKKGEVDIAEYSTAISKLSKAEVEFLNYQSEADLLHLQLKEIAGISVLNR
jgi:hypothetical protein